MTRWANLHTQSLRLRETLRCALPNLFLALARFLLPFESWIDDVANRLILRSSLLKNLGIIYFFTKVVSIEMV